MVVRCIRLATAAAVVAGLTRRVPMACMGVAVAAAAMAPAGAAQSKMCGQNHGTRMRDVQARLSLSPRRSRCHGFSSDLRLAQLEVPTHVRVRLSELVMNRPAAPLRQQRTRVEVQQRWHPHVRTQVHVPRRVQHRPRQRQRR